MAEQTERPTTGSTAAATRRHLAVPGAFYETAAGYWGASRCGVSIGDQAMLDGSWARRGKVAPRIVDLPACGNCARVVGRG